MKIKRPAPLLALALSIVPVQADALQLTSDECINYAIWTRDLIWAREMGINKEKVRVYLASEQHQYKFFRLLVKHLDALWAMPYEFRAEIAEQVYLDCTLRKGKYPDVT